MCLENVWGKNTANRNFGVKLNNLEFVVFLCYKIKYILAKHFLTDLVQQSFLCKATRPPFKNNLEFLVEISHATLSGFFFQKQDKAEMHSSCFLTHSTALADTFLLPIFSKQARVTLKTADVWLDAEEFQYKYAENLARVD